MLFQLMPTFDPNYILICNARKGFIIGLGAMSLLHIKHILKLHILKRQLLQKNSGHSLVPRLSRTRIYWSNICECERKTGNKATVG